MLYCNKQRGEMKRKIQRPRHRLSERGDTIVEVLLAIGILGAVLSGAYVVVNRNATLNRVSQERLEAVELAESQFEKLKIIATNNTAAFGWTGFCIDQNDNYAPASDVRCRVDATGAPTTGTPQYRINISRVAYVSLNGNPQAATRYRASLTWDNFSGDSVDTLDYYYEVYR